MPERVQNHVSSTRALDGIQEDTWNDYSAQWTYHPDHGLNVTIWVTDPTDLPLESVPPITMDPPVTLVAPSTASPPQTSAAVTPSTTIGPTTTQFSGIPTTTEPPTQTGWELIQSDPQLSDYTAAIETRPDLVELINGTEVVTVLRRPTQRLPRFRTGTPSSPTRRLWTASCGHTPSPAP
jgi:hypothetical protein